LTLEDARRLVAEFVTYYDRASYCHTSLCL
jgi:hypothetical protein